MKKSLNGAWQFRQAGKDRWYGARVPGCNFTDLMENNLIPDPFYGVNEKDCAFVGESDWEYRRSFDVSEAELGQAHRQYRQLLYEARIPRQALFKSRRKRGERLF